MRQRYAAVFVSESYAIQDRVVAFNFITKVRQCPQDWNLLVATVAFLDGKPLLFHDPLH